MSKSKEPVRLRQRKMSSGNTSLYLDIYIDGKRSYEYLRLYLIPETSRKDRELNRETLQLAEAIRAKRVVEVRNGEYGFKDCYKLDTNFLEYYRFLCEQRHQKEGSLGNWGNWWSAQQYLERYCKPNTTFKDITPEWVHGFKEFLDRTARVKDKTITTANDPKPLSQNSKAAYFNKVRACINQAFQDGIIPRNPLRGIEGFKQEEKERVYLTFEEVRSMAAAKCNCPVLKRAFLFSCLTGLRKSDIEKMRWSEVYQQGEFTRIIFKQKKTGGQEYLDISPEAVQYLGERRADDTLVFQGFHYSTYILAELKAWAMRAGITKAVTFHSGRHTFAVLMLDLGTDIYTVQKLLGHKMIQTTQLYAHIMDKKKQAAVARIPSINLSETKDEQPPDR